MFTVHQSIVIHHFKVNTVSNSSVLQVGSSGIIKSLSNLYNTGGFTGPAPQLDDAPTATDQVTETPSLVPLTPPSAFPSGPI